MSVTFTVKKKKTGLFVKKSVKNISLNELSKLCNRDLFLAEVGPFENHASYSMPLKDEHYHQLGCVNVSGRSIEMFIDKDTYSVRVFTPSVIDDWKIALEILSNLSIINDSKITSETGEVFDSNTILEFDYLNDINYGIKHSLQESKRMIQPCINYPMHFTIGMFDDLEESQYADAYSKLVVNAQWLDSYYARQHLFEKEDGSLFASHMITTTIPTIITRKFILDYQFLLKGIKEEDVTECKVLIGDQSENGIIGETDLETFISKLDKNKYRYIDALNIEIEALSLEEAREILK